MNIFYVSPSPSEAARCLCDCHVVKMTLETAQILCTVADHRGVWERVNEIAGPIYRPTHRNHPCVLWAAQSTRNFDWVASHGVNLAHEYWTRFGRTHASLRVIRAVWHNLQRRDFAAFEGTDPAQAMPDEFKVPGDPVAAYRAYYRHKAATLSRFTYTRRDPPAWLWTDD